MMTFEKIISGDRRIYLGTLGDGIPESVSGSLAVLLPAFDKEECKNALAMIPALLESNCTQIACVGCLAEQLHDEIDAVVEDMRRLDVLTTFHTDTEDACEYFVFAAGSSASTLLALVAGHSSLVDALKSSVEEQDS